MTTDTKTTTVTFSEFDLHPSILKALSNKGYTNPTPIQEKAIPHLLKGKDLLGIAQTGTGKTAAFALPILNRLSKNKTKVKTKNARTLILTPTRELASQIELNIKEYGKGLGLFSTVIFGGVGKQAQIKAMRRGVDVLIATPGRLLDLMNEGYIEYGQLEVFVLDEADRMLDMGFIKDIKKVIAKLPKEKQTLLFSATMPSDIAKLANSLLHKPVRVEVTPENTTVEKIKQSLNFIEKSNKRLLLTDILQKQEKDITSMLVFSRTKHGADRIVKFLEKANIEAAAIHGNKSQNARERALNSFRTGKIKVLIATDIAARGIDVAHVSHVINFDLPADPESYVHRIGRTARAGREGIAISFCDPEEIKLLKAVEKFIKIKIPVDTTHAYHGAPPTKTKHVQSERSNTPKTTSRDSSNGRGPKSEAEANRKPGSKKSAIGRKFKGRKY
jgi:ATP-dependent RNA helicase RhlE